MTRVAFICVHNSCRSQIAEALGKHLAGDTFESYSAGTEAKDKINSDAVRLMKAIHGIDMEAAQRPKLLGDIPPVDVVVTMGCNVECPFMPCKHREDWGLDDPTGKSDEAFIETIRRIEEKIVKLKAYLNNQTIKEQQRKTGISARRTIQKENAAKLSREICSKLCEHPAYKEADVILSYSPFGGEVDVSFLNERARQDGKVLAFPICRGDGRMVAAVPDGPDTMEIGKYGIMAPVEARCRILAPSEIRLVVVPCTAFDGASRMRAGMGSGYYDRYLPKCINAFRIAAAYESQHISGLCVDDWDAALNAVVTEANWY